MTGVVPGAHERERARRLAGALAEMGVKRLVLEKDGESRDLAARGTDLPAVILRAVGGVLTCPEFGIEVEISRGALVWRARDRAAATMLEEALGE